MGLHESELQAALEAVLYVSGEPLATARLHALFPDEDPAAIDAALSALESECSRAERGLALTRVAGGVRLSTRPEVHAHVQRFVQGERAERLSLRTLETLSVIAYKQPVTAAEIGEIRGVDPSGTVKTLCDKGLVKVVGRKKVVGRPFVYGTTKFFLTTFGIDDLADLPSLKEINDLTSDLSHVGSADVEPLEEEALDVELAREAASDRAEALTAAGSDTDDPAPDVEGAGPQAAGSSPPNEDPDSTPAARKGRGRRRRS